MNRATRKILFFVIFFLLVSVAWDVYINYNVKKQLNSIKLETSFQQQENELIISIKSSQKLPRFSWNDFIILTSEYEKIDMHNFRVSEKETAFINKKQDLYFFKILNPNLDVYQISFFSLKDNENLRGDSFLVTLKSQPISIWSNEFYLSDTF